MHRETFFHSDNKKIQKRYEKIQDYLEQGHLEDALEETRLLLNQDSQNPDVWCLEGIIRLALQEFQAAERSFDRACRLAPGNPVPVLHKARFFLTIQEFEEAGRLAEQALQWAEDPEDRLQGLFLVAQALLGHAVTLIREWEEILPDEEENVTRSTVTTISSEEEEEEPIPMEIQALLEKGVGVAEKAIALDQTNAEGWLLKAMFLSHLQQLEASLECYKQAVELEPQNTFLWHELGGVCVELGRYDEAHDVYSTLYDLEEEQNIQEGMEFGRQEFHRVAIQASQDLQEALMDDWQLPLHLSVQVEEFPGRELIEQASPKQPFDPWTASYVAFQTENSVAEIALDIVLFQRNVERQLSDDSAESLYQNVYDLLHQILLESLEMIEKHDEMEA